MGAAACGARRWWRRRPLSHSFERFVAIDWSGARGRWQPGIALAECDLDDRAPMLIDPPDRAWSRGAALDWLVELAEGGSRTLVGLDLSPAFACADAGSYFPGWSESPDGMADLWALVDRLCAADPDLAADGFVDHREAARHFRRVGSLGDRFVGGRGRWRVCEYRQSAAGLSPSSCFNLVGAAQVGKSSLTGMRVLHRLGGRIPLWPLDPVPATGPVLVEIYTTIAAREAKVRPGRSKIRDADTLDAALAQLGTRPHRPLARYDDHATDAILTAAWMRAAAGRPALWSPDGLEAVARTEGWTFGVP
ncbi:MAG: hypothetical protein ACRYFW_14140 [Janthinobacterium lividum]